MYLLIAWNHITKPKYVLLISIWYSIKKFYFSYFIKCVITNFKYSFEIAINLRTHLLERIAYKRARFLKHALYKLIRIQYKYIHTRHPDVERGILCVSFSLPSDHMVTSGFAFPPILGLYLDAHLSRALQNTNVTTEHWVANVLETFSCFLCRFSHAVWNLTRLRFSRNFRTVAPFDYYALAGAGFPIRDSVVCLVPSIDLSTFQRNPILIDRFIISAFAARRC